MEKTRSGSAGTNHNTQSPSRATLDRPPASSPRWAPVVDPLVERFRAIPSRRFVAIGLAGLVGLAVSSLVNGARNEAAGWGVTSAVLVAAQPIPGGTALSGSEVEIQALPLALLPSEPLASFDEGWVAQGPIAAGQVLTRATVGRDRDGLSESERAVTLPLPLATPELRAGDLVEVFGISVVVGGASGANDGGVRATVVAPSARVASIDEDGITVVVRSAEAPALLRALAVGSVEFARRPAQP